MTAESIQFGIQTVPNRPWPELRQQWRDLEALGFESLWLPDHFLPTFRRELPFMESWTLLAALATATARVRLGVLVSCNTFRHPALLAKQAVTVDHVSGGRLELGLGAGWVEFEHVMFGIPFPAAAERVARFGEALAVIDTLLRNEVSNYDGEHYQLREAPMRPGPLQRPRPPLTLAAHSPRMLRTIAPYVDRWNSIGTLAELSERTQRLDEELARIGREPRSVLRSLLYVAAMMPEESPWDSVEAFVDFAGRFRAAGFRELVLQPPPPDRRDLLERIARETIPAMRAQP
jgi:alkanesulfonate monooxygenase SsuD/methylene tetrahydromethanopterin reductase-like flavin-dependent oxidoreductase (luciferase family)